MDVRFLSRPQLDSVAWDACVAASPNRIVYGYSWYLDAVTSIPGWTWGGLVVVGEGRSYQAVMPVPLRRKWGRWVVHQPLFCQFLAICSREANPDPTPFFRAMQQRFRYGSILHCLQLPTNASLRLQTRPLRTHTLDLSPGYEPVARHYSRDRALNRRRAEAANWQVTDSIDPEPLMQLFRENHAAAISGGVAPWAYAILQTLTDALQKRGLIRLRYALTDGQIQAGALFVQEGNRIIYLFNAASEAGRRGNARTLLIDQVIRENAGRRFAGQSVVLDFETPEKPSIVSFYESFGAVTQPFWEVRYNRLTWAERVVRGLISAAR